MSKPRKSIEHLKSALIVLLIISALFLGWGTDLFGDFFSAVPFFSNTAHFIQRILNGETLSKTELSNQSSTYLNRPPVLAVTNASGVHYGVKYGGGELTKLYDITRDLLEQALSNASEPSAVGERTWQDALQAKGVFYDYVYPVPLSVLAGWVGAGTEISAAWGSTSVRRLCITVSGNTGNLYYQDAVSGLFYQAKGLKLTGNITDSLATFEPNSARFAFEFADKTKSAEKYQLLMLDQPVHPDLSAENPMEDQANVDTVLVNLNLGANVKPYTDATGTRVYVENQSTLRIHPDGTASYQFTDSGTGETGTATVGTLIDIARKKAEATVGAVCGDATIHFMKLEQFGDGSSVVTFQYGVAGGQVFINGEPWAAKVTVKNGAVTGMELRFRQYAVTDQNETLMPEIQAAVASAGELILAYPDTGTDSVRPAWIAG